MPQPWLSVVMPLHRGAQWLDITLGSIPAMDVAGPIEIIIRDSTPEGPCDAAIDAHRGRLMIDYAYQPDIPSWTRKTNMGVADAQADYVCTLHQDDIWLPERVEIARDMIAAYPDAAMLLTPAHIIANDGAMLGVWRPPLPTGLQDAGNFHDALLVQNSIAMPAPIFRRDAYLAAGGLDESLWYTPDWDLWMKLADQGPVAFDPRPATAFRIHGSSQTMTGDRGEFARQLDIVLERNLRPGCKTERISRASVKINTLLAEAADGKSASLAKALLALARLGPVDATRYLHYSRLMERVLPRLRQRIKGAI